MRRAPAILSTLPPAPALVWRVDTGFSHSDNRTAAVVVRHDQQRHGHALGVVGALLSALEEYPAEALLWVTLTHDDALRYGEMAIPLRLDIPAYIVAKDEHGGVLLLFTDDLTEPAGGDAMADRIEHDRAHVFDIADVRADKREQLAGEIAAHYHDATTALQNGNQDHSFVQFVQAQVKIDQMTALGGGAPSHLPQPEDAARLAEDEEEQKRRATRGGDDMANSAHAQLGANIRPEVGSGPAGLETYTTQKSEDYHVPPEEQAISEYFRSRFAEAERSANPSMLTLEAIAADPWNAVALPLPDNANKELLTAARAAAESCAINHYDLMEKARAGDYTPPGYEPGPISPDRHEEDEGKWFDADRRLAAIDARLEQADEQEAAKAAHLQTVNEDSRARQTAEQADRSGDPAAPAFEASISDYFRNRAKEAENPERESGGHDLTDRDPGRTTGDTGRGD